MRALDFDVDELPTEAEDPLQPLSIADVITSCPAEVLEAIFLATVNPASLNSA